MRDKETLFNELMDKAKKDRCVTGEVEHPRFLIIGKALIIGFEEVENALMYKFVAEQKMRQLMTLADITEYDWETNPSNLIINSIEDTVMSRYEEVKRCVESSRL